jgi:hypothetical protein
MPKPKRRVVPILEKSSVKFRLVESQTKKITGRGVQWASCAMAGGGTGGTGGRGKANPPKFVFTTALSAQGAELMNIGEGITAMGLGFTATGIGAIVGLPVFAVGAAISGFGKTRLVTYSKPCKGA